MLQIDFTKPTTKELTVVVGNESFKINVRTKTKEDHLRAVSAVSSQDFATLERINFDRIHGWSGVCDKGGNLGFTKENLDRVLGDIDIFNAIAQAIDLDDQSMRRNSAETINEIEEIAKRIGLGMDESHPIVNVYLECANMKLLEKSTGLRVESLLRMDSVFVDSLAAAARGLEAAAKEKAVQDAK